jgi:hypothetical protein
VFLTNYSPTNGYCGNRTMRYNGANNKACSWIGPSADPIDIPSLQPTWLIFFLTSFLDLLTLSSDHLRRDSPPKFYFHFLFSHPNHLHNSPHPFMTLTVLGDLFMSQRFSFLIGLWLIARLPHPYWVQNACILCSLKKEMTLCDNKKDVAEISV